jgi:hypothetical protein
MFTRPKFTVTHFIQFRTQGVEKRRESETHILTIEWGLDRDRGGCSTGRGLAGCEQHKALRSGMYRH